MKTTAVHFTVDGEGFTELVRNMWAEGRPHKAFTVVNEGLGMNEDLFLQLVEGKKKFINILKSEKIFGLIKNRN